MSFEPPAASKGQLQGIDFGTAVPIAAKLKAVFDADDQRPGNQDPNRCKALLRFPTGAVFWSSKMAIDADGPAAGPGRLSGNQLDPSDGQDGTSYSFPGEHLGISSEAVPYVVVPGGAFRDETGLSLGDIVMVIFGDKAAGALIGDIGPTRKIGEGSIRVHELLHPPAADPCSQRDRNGFCRRVRNASIGEDVLFFAFPGSEIASSFNQSSAEPLLKSRAEELLRALASVPS
jgi:hypothetical protein